MPPVASSLQLRNVRATDKRLTAAHRQVARDIATIVLRYATARDPNGTPIIPMNRSVLEDLKTEIWDRVLRPFYIGQGTEPLRGPIPQSPFAQLIVDGIEKAVRISVNQQVALVKSKVKDPVVLQWLTGPRSNLPTREMVPTRVNGRITELLAPSRAVLSGLRGPTGRIDVDRAQAALVRPKGTYDPFHRFVDPNGYRLSDRIWRSGTDVRSRIDQLLDYHVARGTAAVRIASVLEPFLTPGGALTKTKTPYGTEGSYSARRLARTEVTAAGGRATVNAANANPFVSGVQWILSSRHRDIDQCDANARGGPNGNGIYPPGEVPGYPNHPHELCTLAPVATGNVDDLVASLRQDIQAARGDLIAAASGGDPDKAIALRGLLNPDFLTRAVMDGNLTEAIMAAVKSVGPSAPLTAAARTAIARRSAERPPDPAAAPPKPRFGTVNVDLNDSEDVFFQTASQFGIRNREELQAASEQMFGLPPGYNAQVSVTSGRDALAFETRWFQPDKDHPDIQRFVGSSVREIDREFSKELGREITSIHHSILEFEPQFQGLGFADRLYTQQIEFYKANGMDRVVINADITIGKYAWAKRGFEYEDASESRLKSRNEQFQRWVAYKKIPEPEGGWPTFRSAYEFATYEHPGGYTLSHSQIEMHGAEGILKPGQYQIGKAFMLDHGPYEQALARATGHGAWDAVMWLTERPK